MRVDSVDRHSGHLSRSKVVGLLVVFLLAMTLVLQVASSADLRESSGLNGDVELGCTAGDVLEFRGDVDFQGRAGLPASTWLIPVRVQMWRIPGGAPYRDQESTVQDTAGRFVVPSVNAHTYDICVKGRHTLQVCQQNIVLDCPGVDCGCIPQVPSFGTLPEGDANGDNSVNAVDASIMATYYWGYDPRADFNEEGYIDARDASLLASNYWRTGQSLSALSDAAPDRTTPKEAPPDEFATLMLEPVMSVVQVGELFTLTVELDTEDQMVAALDAFVQFDPAYLQVVDGAGQPSNEVVPDLTGMDTVIRNEVNSSTGLISYAAMAPGGASPGQGNMAIFRVPFKAVAATPEEGGTPGQIGTQVEFLFDAGNEHVTMVAQGGYDVLLDAHSAKVQVNAAAESWELMLPQVYHR